MQEQRYRCHEFQCLLDCLVRYRNRCLGVATDVPGLGIECREFQVSLLRCIRHSVDGFKQISSVDCSGIKGVNFQCLLDCHQISKQVFLVLRPMFQVSVSSC
ncbi:uncharacterized protein [Dysidea avara]|uniref:uncharacterized protein isoform X2 n=1 Tax=Dysidea avara TaxID=196820 RepID=UPI003333F955